MRRTKTRIVFVYTRENTNRKNITMQTGSIPAPIGIKKLSLTIWGRLYKTLNHFFNHCFVVK